MSSYDDRYIEEFEYYIEFRYGNYFVSLTRHRETLRDVPSNIPLAKTIDYKAAQRNAFQNLWEAYNQTFAHQLTRGILSEISIDQINHLASSGEDRPLNYYEGAACVQF